MLWSKAYRPSSAKIRFFICFRYKRGFDAVSESKSMASFSSIKYFLREDGI